MKEWIPSLIVTAIEAFRTAQNPRTPWKTPLIAAADAGDSLFLRLKEVVRPTHALPQDLLPGARSVIAYFLPFDERIPRSNQAGHLASEEWAVAYIETNALIAAINAHLAAGLRERGYQAAVIPATHNFDEETLMSDWSHKHVAYIAGLGTFGLHHMLITAQGCTGRLGTLVTDAVIEPTPRPTGEACLHKHNGSCLACIRKCVAGALTDTGAGFDRHACYAVCLENGRLHAALGLADVCGKCASIVPCSFTNPVAQLRSTTL
jgi:epoxyqueuosine reductase QueG